MKKRTLLFSAMAVASQFFVSVQAKDYYYPFNKDFTDSISGAEEGVVSGDVVLTWDDTRKSTVAVFNEVAGSATEVANRGYITLPAEIMNTEQLTVSCWAMHNDAVTVGNWGRFWDFGPDNANYILLSYSQDAGMKPTVDTKVGGVGGPRVQSPSPITDGVWNHYVVTHGDGFTRLYMDGVEVHNMENTQSLIEMYSAGACTNYIGKSHYDDAPLVGRIDEMRIFSRVLTPEEVTLLFEGKFTAIDQTEAEAANIFAANGSIQINLNAVAAGSIEVFDITGKIVSKTTSILPTNSIAVNNGLYLVKLTQGNSVKTTKVLVK